jgi:S-formylglutathione hydrolase
MDLLSSSKAFGGSQRVYRHQSETCACPMTFAIFLPPQSEERPVPVLWYLSGLTCSHQNVMDKGEYRAAAAANGVAIICPDTSPRGDGVPDEPENWQFGSGAGFYLDATQEPWAKNYRMESYIRDELPAGHFWPFHGRPWRDHARAEEPAPLWLGFRLRADQPAFDRRLVAARAGKISRPG